MMGMFSVIFFYVFVLLGFIFLFSMLIWFGVAFFFVALVSVVSVVVSVFVFLYGGVVGGMFVFVKYVGLVFVCFDEVEDRCCV